MDFNLTSVRANGRPAIVIHDETADNCGLQPAGEERQHPARGSPASHLTFLAVTSIS